MGAEQEVALTSKPLPAELSRRAEVDGPGPPQALAVVSGSIQRVALWERAAVAGVPADSYAATTLEDVAARLVAAGAGCSAGDITIVEDVWLRHRLERLLTTGGAGGALGPLATRHAGDVEAVVDALDEWWRATDAGSPPDQRQLRATLDAVPAFHADPTRELFESFETITDRLEAELDPTTFLSRSHLVSAGRTHIHAFTTEFPSIRQIFVGGISVLDNPTLRLLEAMGTADGIPPITVCAGAGTLETFHSRFESAFASSNCTISGPPWNDVDGPTVACLRDLARGRTPDLPPEEALQAGSLDIECVTVPRARDEMEYVLQAATAVETQGGRAGQVLAVAPDAGVYRVAAESASRRYDVPVNVETRFALAHTPLVRAVTATLELAGAVRPTLDTVLAPLRYGALPPDPTRDTSLGDTELAAVREAVNLPAASLPDWRDAFAGVTEEAGAVVESYLEMVERFATQPVTGAVVASLVETIVDTYPSCSLQEVGRYRPDRAGGRSTYPSDRTKRDTLRVGQRTMRVLDNLRSPTWEGAVTVFTNALAGAGGGRPTNDAMAVDVIDSGNAYFREAPWVIVTGLSEGRFPAVGISNSLIPPTVREAVAESACPYMYLDSERAQLERAVDQFHAALRCATERVTLLRPARDSEGREQPASRFAADLFEAGRRHREDTHPVDGYLAGPEPESWQSNLPATVHQRLATVLLYSAPTPVGQRVPLDESPDVGDRLAAIAGTLDEETVAGVEAARSSLEDSLRSPTMPAEITDVSPTVGRPARAPTGQD